MRSGRDKLDLGPEPRAFMGLAARIASALVLVAASLALLAGGFSAFLSTLAGGSLAGLALLSLGSGLLAVLVNRAGASRARLWAAGALVPRQALLAAALFVAVVVLELPAPWLLVGVTAWPVALIAAAVLVSHLPSARALTGLGPES